MYKLRRRTQALLLPGALAAATLLMFAVSATAATQVGKVFVPDGTLACNDTAVVQATTVAPEPSFSIPPGGGVITRWRHHAGPGAGQTLALLVLRTSDGGFTVVGASPAMLLVASAMNVFPTRLQVEAGDQIGIWAGAAPVRCGQKLFPAGNTVRYQEFLSAAPTVGPLAMGGSDSEIVLAVAADLEPDADKDGFGDETQDQCPSNASIQIVACPAPAKDGTAPQALLGGAASQSLKKGVVKVTVNANEDSTATATGALAVPGASRSFRLNSASATLKAAVEQTLKLKITKKAKGAARSALRRGKKVRARVDVVVRDAAGNVTLFRHSVRLRR
jgi:hypothetical protein